jgi:hypothetical protein
MDRVNKSCDYYKTGGEDDPAVAAVRWHGNPGDFLARGHDLSIQRKQQKKKKKVFYSCAAVKRKQLSYQHKNRL